MERIDRWVDAHMSDMLEDLIRIVRVPSIAEPSKKYPPFGKGCRDVLDVFLARCAGFGYETHNYEYYVGEAACGAGDTSVGIWSHLDVVPAGDPAAWRYPPFEGTVVANRYLIGRGAQDNKMPAVGALYALNYLRESGVPLRHRYSLYLGTNEECGMADIAYFRAHYPCPTLSLVPDSGFPVCVGLRGNCVLRLSTPRLAAFEGLSVDCPQLPGLAPAVATATLPDGTRLSARGETLRLSEREPGQPIASEALLDQLIERFSGTAREALKALRALATDSTGAALGLACADERSGSLRLSAGRIGAEDGTVGLEVMLVLPLCADTAALEPTARAACEAAGLSLTLLRMREPHAFPAEHPIVAKLTEIYRETTGYAGEPFVMSGGCYAGALPNAVAYGPGMPGRAFPREIFRPGCGDYHQADESEDLERLRQFTRVYIRALLALNEMDVRVQGENE